MAISVQTCRACVPGQGTTKRHEASSFGAYLRLVAVACRMFVGVAVVFMLLGIARVLPAARLLVPRYMRHFYKALLATCRITAAVDGPRTNFVAPVTPVRVVANHVSCLDVIVLGSLQPVTMISKAEVKQWPLIGAVAAKLGTIFLARTSYDNVARTRVVAGYALREGCRRRDLSGGDDDVPARNRGLPLCDVPGGRGHRSARSRFASWTGTRSSPRRRRSSVTCRCWTPSAAS